MTTTFDNHKNLAYSAVATAPSPATSGTSLVVTTGDGSKFPTPPFNLLMWPGGGATANQGNAEIARVTGIATDTLTIVRGQEGTTAQSVAVGYQVALTSTAKLLTDIEAAINATLGGSLSGTLPNPTIANGAVGTAQLAAGAATQRVANNRTGLSNTTTSAAYVDVDATNCALTLTTAGGDLLALWNSSAADGTSTSKIWSVALALDGAAEVAVFASTSPVVGIGTFFTLAYLFTGLAAGAHTVKARWQIAGGDTLGIGGRSYMTAIEYRA